MPGPPWVYFFGDSPEPVWFVLGLGHFDYRINAAEGIVDLFAGSAIMHPTAIHYELIFVAAGSQWHIFNPMATSAIEQGSSAWIPVVERASDENFISGRIE
jgi:hypothetical protein